jgi:hypothetical protein
MCILGFLWGIKGRYFHVACIECVERKDGNTSDEQEYPRDHKNQGEKDKKSES